MCKRIMQVSIVLCLCLALITSCGPTPPPPPTDQTSPVDTDSGEPQSQPTAPTASEAETKAAEPILLDASEVYLGKFADYKPIAAAPSGAFSGGYSLPLELGLVENLSEFDLSDAQLALLKANGFVANAPTNDPNKIFTEFYQGYESIRYAEVPVFITTDSVYHVYHLVFDKMLRDLERSNFIPILKELTSALVTATTAQYQELKGTDLEKAALKNAAFFLVGANLLNTGDSTIPEAQPYVEAELALINAADQMAISPLWANDQEPQDMQLIEDYTQYIPRGHYTRSPELEMYFRAMMWYGRLTYRLKVKEETQRALLLTQALRSTTTSSGEPALVLWQNIYDPTVFIVGKADDLGVYEYGAVSDKVYGPDPALINFADDALMQKFIATARQLPPPQINSMWVWIWQDQDDVTQGFRFMGQRFTLDEYVFGQLMWRNVGTTTAPRNLPKALDFFGAMGSDTAMTILEEMGETNFENYTSQMTKVKEEMMNLGLDSWTQNLYWSWLYALQPLITEKGEAYPAFMRTDAWAKKDLQAALSSWTELKHDTILYSKQVMAEMGGGGPEHPPKGYVEPNPEAYARLLALVQMTKAGLESRGLLVLNETTQWNLINLEEKLTFLLDISLKELNGGQITDFDYWDIQYYGGWLESMTVASADKDDSEGHSSYLEDQKSPVVADIATGSNIAGEIKVLEEGVGYPVQVWVVLPDQPYRIGVGVVYTYYEFEVAPSQRMTDETWRGLLESPNAPATPDWTSAFIQP